LGLSSAAAARAQAAVAVGGRQELLAEDHLLPSTGAAVAAEQGFLPLRSGGRERKESSHKWCDQGKFHRHPRRSPRRLFFGLCVGTFEHHAPVLSRDIRFAGTGR